MNSNIQWEFWPKSIANSVEVSPCSEATPVAQLLNKFPTFNGTRRFITMLTRALHWSLHNPVHTTLSYLSKIHFLAYFPYFEKIK
jgi:hypothetical protein